MSACKRRQGIGLSTWKLHLPIYQGGAQVVHVFYDSLSGRCQTKIRFQGAYLNATHKCAQIDLGLCVSSLQSIPHSLFSSFGLVPASLHLQDHTSHTPRLSFVKMPTYQSSYPNNSHPYYPHHVHQPPDEHKPHHDDLIDEYASPYAKTSHHQTFAVEASPSSPTEHRRRPSFPASKISYSSDYTKESGDVSKASPSRVYPPLPSTKNIPAVKETDCRSLWQKVCCFRHTRLSSSELSQDCARILGMSAIRSHRSRSDSDRSWNRG